MTTSGPSRPGSNPGRPAASRSGPEPTAPRALDLTAALADGWLPSIGRIGLAGATELRSAVLSGLRDHGRDGEPFTFAANVALRFKPGADSPVPGRQLLSGSAGSVTARLTEITQAGFTVLNMLIPDPGDVERFATEVMPAVRRNTGQPGAR